MSRGFLCRIMAGFVGLGFMAPSAHAGIVLTSILGTEGVSSDTSTITIDSTGNASVSTDFIVTGSTAESNAFGTLFNFTLDAVSLADVESGAKLADGTIDRDSVGKLGVREVNNGINPLEGFLLGLDATGLPAGYGWQLTGIQFEYVDGDESYTIIGRNGSEKKLSSSANGMVDLSGLSLIVQGGSSDVEFASVFANSMSDTNAGFRVTAFELEAVVPAGNTGSSWRSALYPEDWQPPTSRSFATDKLIQDFSYAGYHRGEDPIPDVTWPVFDVVAYGADPTGVADSTVAIQAAIDAAGAAGGGVVFLPSGTFNVSMFYSSDSYCCLRIHNDGVVLRGNGPDQTFVLNTTTNMNNKSVVWIRGDNASVGSPIYLTADAYKPTHRLSLSDASAFAVGDFVRLEWDFTDEWVAEHEQQAIWNETNGYPSPSLYQREVMAVNTNENWIEIDVPTRYAILVRDHARVLKMNGRIAECGVEGLSIGNVQHSGAEWGDDDYVIPGTSAYDAHGSWLFSVRRARDCWIRNVRSYQPAGNTSTCHMLSNGIILYRAFRITVQDCFMGYPQYGGNGGNGYMYRLLAANDCLVQNCTAEFSRHGFVVSHAGTSGDVFHRCEDRVSNHATGSTGSYITGLGDGSDNHMHFSHSSLWDQCVAFDSFWEAKHRGATGNHGLSSAHSVYWNSSGSGTAYPDKLVVTEQGRYGYVIGTSGDVSAVQNLDPARYNTAPFDHVEGVGQGGSLYPQSLYVDQLIRRLDLGVFVTSVGSDEPGSSAEFEISFSTNGMASVSNADFVVTGSANYSDAGGGAVRFIIDAMDRVSTHVGVNLGAKITDGEIDRSSNGGIGVVGGENGGINAYEGLAFSFDASGLDTSLRVQLTRIDVEYVDFDESLTIVNRADPEKRMTVGGNSTGSDITIDNTQNSMDVSSLGLIVSGGDLAVVAALYANDMPASNDNFRVKGFAFKVLSPEPTLVFSGIEHNASGIRLNWSSIGLTGGIDIYRAVALNGIWEQIATNYVGTNFIDLIPSTNPAAFYKAETASP